MSTSPRRLRELPLRGARPARNDNVMHELARRTCLVWAGLSIGGVWIAAPAKFAAPSLSLATALEVGRAQFFWLNIGQLLICALLLVSLVWAKRFAWRACMCAMLSFAAQIAVLASLDMATLDVIGGGAGNGALHTTFLVLEALKLVCLMVAGFLPVTTMSAPLVPADAASGENVGSTE